MIRFVRQEDGTYTRTGDVGLAGRVTIHFEGSVSAQDYALDEAEALFKNHQTGQGLKREWYEIRPVAGSEKRKKDPPLPDLPARERDLAFKPVNNVPSIVLAEGTYDVPMFLTEGGEKKLVEVLRKRPDINFYAAIIAEQGFQVVDGLTADKAFPLALATVRLWWHELAAEQHVIDVVLDDERMNVRRAYQTYLQVNKLKIKHAHQMAVKPGVKVGKLPWLPKDITFVVNKPGDGLKGEYKQIYDTVVALGGTAQVERLTDEAFKRGYVGKGKNPRYGPRWLALQLVKRDILYVQGTQAVIPGTPEPLPKS